MKKHITIGPLDRQEGALDFSWLLDAPAGRHGFVRTHGGHFQFEDGTRARFIGFNLAARSNTPPHDVAEKLAARLAGLGVNLVRLHAADAPISDERWSWASSREAPLLDYESGTSRRFHPEGLDRFDYLIAKLEEKGIYLHIDLYVARQFMPGDGLDYPGAPGSCLKCYGMVQERLIALQQEFARELLTHVNPYTGRALKDDPAVMTVQINNEDSAIKGTMDSDGNPAMQPYRDEVRRRWNAFLLSKYGDRKHLAAAWTFEDKCALAEDEDPEEGTVAVVAGSFYQPANDPMGAWGTPADGVTAPCRYADYMEFGMAQNRRFYRRMKEYLRSIGVRVPIATSNLVAGAADVWGHLDADVMENNSYFNHPILPCTQSVYSVAGPVEAVSVDPLTVQRGIGSMATTISALAALAAVRNKPLVVTEWNDYGLHPFHSTSFMSMIAYACLNDWDGLILYNYATADRYDEPADEIVSVFDAYNDPALICQWGLMAEVFLKGLIRPAEKPVELAFTQNDLLTLPPMQMMPLMYLSYVTGVRSTFDGCDRYEKGAAPADGFGSGVAVNAGYTDDGDLSEAEHGVYYAWSDFADPYRRARNPQRLSLAAAAGGEERPEEPVPGVHLGRNLVFDDIRALAGNGDYTVFARMLDRALKKWKALPEDTGLTERGLVSATGEVVFDPAHRRFQVQTPFFSYFSGRAADPVPMEERVAVRADNERITLALLPLSGLSGEERQSRETVEGGDEPLCRMEKANDFLLLAVSDTGMDETTIGRGPTIMGFPMNQVTLAGKLFADTLEGEIRVRAGSATLSFLAPSGRVIRQEQGEREGNETVFRMDGSTPSCQYRLTLEK